MFKLLVFPIIFLSLSGVAQAQERFPGVSSKGHLFPTCEGKQSTNSTALANEMFEQVLGFEGAFQKDLVNKAKGTGFTLLEVKGSLQVHVAQYNIRLPAHLCQESPHTMRVELNYGGARYYLRVTRIDANRVRVAQIEASGRTIADSGIFKGATR